MAGIYNGYLDVVDQDGRSCRTLFTVRVYDWDLDGSEGGIHATYTNKCYRAAILAKQGVGIIEWGGDNWVWPEAYVGTCKGMTKSGENISLILNRRNGRFYQVGIPELWTDRTSQYAGVEIDWRLKLKEHLALAGEMQMIEHRESHLTIRPYREDYRGQPGYSADGLRDTQQVTFEIFRDGEQNTPFCKVQNAPIYGDCIYGKRPKAKRLQAQIRGTSSGFRITKVQQLHENCDERVGPKYAVSAESGWQREFSTPDLWLVRNRTNPMRNKATGQDVAGSYAALTAGPDGQTQSAMLFGAADHLDTVLPIITEGISLIWLGAMGAVGNIWTFPQFTASIVIAGTDYYLRITNGVWLFDQILAWDGISWIFLAISIESSYIRIYENGLQKGLIANPGIASFGGITQILGGGMVVSVFDIRRIPRIVSGSALGYYYDNVVNDSGSILPMQK
jgi:hypothetical protein